MRKKLLTILLLTVVALDLGAREKYNFNPGWLMKVGDIPSAQKSSFNDKDWQKVTLPHAFNEDEAFKVDIHDLTDTIVWYRKHFTLPSSAKGGKVFIEFEGARQGVDLYVNGTKVGSHENGVMAFGFDLTPYVRQGKNVIAVRVDNNWDFAERTTGVKYQWSNKNFNANYGGLPKNVWLHITGPVYQTLPLYSNLQTTGVYVYSSDMRIKERSATINAESEVRNESKKSVSAVYKVELLERDGTLVK